MSECLVSQNTYFINILRLRSAPSYEGKFDSESYSICSLFNYALRNSNYTNMSIIVSHEDFFESSFKLMKIDKMK
jgi:hypothetical protein